MAIPGFGKDKTSQDEDPFRQMELGLPVLHNLSRTEGVLSLDELMGSPPEQKFQLKKDLGFF